MKEFKHNGVTFKVILPKKIPKEVNGKALYEQILNEDHVALMLTCESDEGEYKIKDDSGELLVYVEYKIDEKEYLKSENSEVEE